MLYNCKCCCQWAWLFKRVLPMELQAGAIAGSRTGLSIIRSLMFCVEHVEEEETALFHWSQAKDNNNNDVDNDNSSAESSNDSNQHVDTADQNSSTLMP